MQEKGDSLNIPIHPLFLATHQSARHPQQPTSCRQCRLMPGLALTRRKGSVSQPLNWPASHVPSRLRKRDPLLHPSNSTTTRSRKEVAIIIFASPQDLSLVLSVWSFSAANTPYIQDLRFPIEKRSGHPLLFSSWVYKFGLQPGRVGPA